MRFEIQGRRLVRRDGLVVIDEIRSATATDRAVADGEARAMVADGFTSWVFQVQPGPGVSPVYRLVRRLTPEPGPEGRAGAGRVGAAAASRF